MTTTEECVDRCGPVRGLFGEVAYCAGLAVVSVAGLGLVVVGRPGAAARLSGRWQRLLGGPVVQPVRALPAAGNAVLGLLLGLLSLLPLGVEVLFVTRGVFYGVVDRGPYDTSWGGPGRGGAWLVHFLVSVPFALVGLAVMSGIARLHRRCGAYLGGGRGGAWVLPVALLSCGAGAILTVAWLHQL